MKGSVCLSACVPLKNRRGSHWLILQPFSPSEVENWTEFFFCRPWSIHLGIFITIHLAFAFCSLTKLCFSELLGGGKAKASTGDGQNSQAQQPGGTRCFISCNSDTNQVPLFYFLHICSASTELVNSKSTLGRNVEREPQFTKASSCPWPFHSSPCAGCWLLLLNASLELGRDEKLSIMKRNCLSNEDQYKSSCWGKQSYMQKHSKVGAGGGVCILSAGPVTYSYRNFRYLSEISITNVFLCSDQSVGGFVNSCYSHSFIFLLLLFALQADVYSEKKKKLIALTGIKFRCKFTWGRRNLYCWWLWHSFKLPIFCLCSGCCDVHRLCSWKSYFLLQMEMD